MSASPAQLRVLAAVQHFASKHRYAPSIRDITDALGFASTNATAEQLTRLRKHGYLSSTPGIARSLFVTAAGLEALRPLQSTNSYDGRRR